MCTVRGADIVSPHGIPVRAPAPRRLRASWPSPCRLAAAPRVRVLSLSRAGVARAGSAMRANARVARPSKEGARGGGGLRVRPLLMCDAAHQKTAVERGGAACPAVRGIPVRPRSRCVCATPRARPRTQHRARARARGAARSRAWCCVWASSVRACVRACAGCVRAHVRCVCLRARCVCARACLATRAPSSEVPCAR